MSKKTEYIKSAIDKWENRILQDVLKKKNRGYNRYWIKCGYCFFYDGCLKCPLYLDKYEKHFYCGGTMLSVAGDALNYANTKQWDEAEENIRILLRKMKQDLEEAERKEVKSHAM